jgi:transposase
MPNSSKKDLKTKTRKIAIDLLNEGWNQSKVANFLGVSQGSISNWKNAFEKQGLEGLKAVPNTGRPSRLNKAQKEQLTIYLNQGAEAMGFTGNSWTQKRVSRLIAEKFSIEIKARQCGNILKELDYVLKLPQTKSYEQDLEKVET